MKLSKAFQEKLDMHGFGYVFRHVWHIIFGRGQDPQDVRWFLVKAIHQERWWKHQNFPTLPRYTNKDRMMRTIKSWVVENIEYKRDYDQHGKVEKWQTCWETLELMTGDCEDMTILVMGLGAYYGVPELRMRLMAGDVVANTESGLGGHCWLDYQSEITENTYPVDAAYDPDSKLPYKHRTPTALDQRYVNSWWGDGVSSILI